MPLSYLLSLCASSCRSKCKLKYLKLFTFSLLVCMCLCEIKRSCLNVVGVHHGKGEEKVNYTGLSGNYRLTPTTPPKWLCWAPPTKVDVVKPVYCRWYKPQQMSWQWLSSLECVVIAGLSWVPWLLCTTGVQPHRVQSVWLGPGEAVNQLSPTHSSYSYSYKWNVTVERQDVVFSWNRGQWFNDRKFNPVIVASTGLDLKAGQKRRDENCQGCWKVIVVNMMPTVWSSYPVNILHYCCSMVVANEFPSPQKMCTWLQFVNVNHNAHPFMVSMATS